MDPSLDELVARPFFILHGQHPAKPFIFASPHSGRLYPETFVHTTALDFVSLRFSEDAFVDELFDFVPRLGATLLAARFPRVFLDANRAVEEIDPTMFDALPALPLLPRTARVAAGLGVIPRVVREGIGIYQAALPASEAQFRLENFYRPYHRALGRMVQEIYACFGVSVIVDCHSMPSAPRLPDFVIGDHYGTSASPVIISHALHALRSLGFRVACNIPYAGGYTTERYGRPVHGTHAIQLEINRALYLDEQRVEKLPTFLPLRSQLESFARHLTEISDELTAPSVVQCERA